MRVCRASASASASACSSPLPLLPARAFSAKKPEPLTPVVNDLLGASPSALRDAILARGHAAGDASGRRALLVNPAFVPGYSDGNHRDMEQLRSGGQLLEVSRGKKLGKGLNLSDIQGHEAVFLEVGRRSGQLLSVSLHRTLRGPGAGGIRLWRYETVQQMLTDGLRLARGMSHKSALAGLNWGGGKGIVFKDPAVSAAQWADPEFRAAVFRDFGDMCTSMHGVYYAAEDVGLDVTDLNSVFTRTRFTTCIAPEFGGSGNPSGPTARGVVAAMEGAVTFLEPEGNGSLGGKLVAMQGTGNVSDFMIEEILMRGGRVVATDIDEDRVKYVQGKYGGSDAFRATVVPRGDNEILATRDADIVAPNALGGILNEDTIPRIAAPIICGAANNQLLDPATDDVRIHALGRSLYVPDFVANRMGIVNCADEAFGSFPGAQEDPSIARHLTRGWANSVYQVVQRVADTSRTTGTPMGATALALAERETMDPHPIWPDRWRSILSSLVESDWA
jgi:glutamate dehydrogenase (NAD(P)+)